MNIFYLVEKDAWDFVSFVCGLCHYALFLARLVHNYPYIMYKQMD